MSNTERNSPQPLQIAGIEISVAEQTPLVLTLLAVIQRQEREIQDLRDEIHRISGVWPCWSTLICRDTFLSLKKTCRKLGISFRAFLHDRLTRAGQIPLLSHVIRSVAKQGPPAGRRHPIAQANDFESRGHLPLHAARSPWGY